MTPFTHVSPFTPPPKFSGNDLRKNRHAANTMFIYDAGTKAFLTHPIVTTRLTDNPFTYYFPRLWLHWRKLPAGRTARSTLCGRDAVWRHHAWRHRSIPRDSSTSINVSVNSAVLPHTINAYST